MARNGSGTFSRSVADYVFDTVIDETKVNAEMDDMATALTNSIATNGETPVTANLPMATNKHTGVGAGTARTDYADVASVQDGKYLWGGTAGGTADVITLTMAPAITAHTTGEKIRFLSSGANTTNVTLNPNAVGAKALTKNGATALAPGDIPNVAIVEAVYDGTQYQLLNVAGENKTIQVVNVLDGAVATGTTTMPIDDTIPQNTEGDEYITLAITPTNASNKLRIDVVIQLANSNASTVRLVAALFQDSTADALAVTMAASLAANNPSALVLTHYMTAGTTSSTTFKVRGGSDLAGTTTFNGAAGARLFGGVNASSITITEIRV